MPAAARGVRGSFGRGLAGVAAAGLALRVVYVTVLTPHLQGRGDSSYYHQLGTLIADGRGFVDPGNGTPTALHPPLFPLVLALGRELGLTSYRADRLVVCVLGTAAIVAVGLLARRVAGPRAGLIAAALAAVYPVLISADGSVMSETLLGLLVALAMLAAYTLRDRPAPWRAALLGALVGLAALARGEALFLLVLLVLPVCVRLPARRLLMLALAFMAAAAVLAPWTIRNASTFQRFVPIATNEGNLIAGANCHDTYYGRDIGSWQIACVPPGPVIDESVAAAHFRSAGLHYARKHTSRLLLVVPARLARTFELLQPLRQARHAEGRAYWIEVAGAIGFYLVAAGGLAGAVGLRRRGEGLAILLAPVGLAVLASAIGYGVPRFRHPGDIALVVLAAVALSAAPLARVSRGRGSAEPPGPARRWPRRALAREPGRGPAA